MILRRLARPALSPLAPVLPLHGAAAAHRPASLPCCLKSISTLPRLPIFEAIARHDPASAAVVHSSSGATFTYADLVRDVSSAKDRLQRANAGIGLSSQRIAFLVENSYDYVGQFIASLPHPQIPFLMPFSKSHPPRRLGLALHSCAAFSCFPGTGAAIHSQPE